MAGLAYLVAETSHVNRALLATRSRMQRRIDSVSSAFASRQLVGGQKEFLSEIGFLLPTPQRREVVTSGIDDELSLVPAPQLVVPLSNARSATKAANARWGLALRRPLLV